MRAFSYAWDEVGGLTVWDSTQGAIRDLPITPAKLLSPGVERRSCSAQRREE